MKLAIHGGTPVRSKIFPGNHVIGEEEKAAAERVLNSEVLSGFYGSWSDKFYGGPEVRALESEWASYFGVKHAIAVNSATSGLYAAVGAVGCGPGDEVIVSPYTMCASATAALIFGSIPVFADIEERFFCLDPDSISLRINPRTKAILAVDIFGHPYDAAEINAIAKKHGLLVIEDASQAPGALDGKRYAGALGDIGVFSLNCHKHIHCGEGGIVVTDDDVLAERVRLIRNHGEAVVGPKGETNIANIIGFNFRMTELEAAISRAQLQKLPGLLEARRRNCTYLNKRLADVPWLTVPAVREDCIHSYYLHALKYDELDEGVTRESFVSAVKCEIAPMKLRESDGPVIRPGYVKPLYLLPMYQQRIAQGKDGFPWNREPMSTVSYAPGICPVAERMFDREVIIHEYMIPSMNESDLHDFASAIEKVWEYRDELRQR